MKSTRRHALMGLAGLLASPVSLASASLRSTPSQFAGPYYPVIAIPLLNDLTNHGGLVARGEHLVLDGSVTDNAGKALEGVLIEIWQADFEGRYRHPNAPETGMVDPGYAGFGATRTGPGGDYSFRTILPVPYTGRPPHIHARLHLDGRELLTTQIYLDGKQEENGFFFNLIARLYGDRNRLTIAPQASGQGHLAARFDFVVEV